MRTAADEPGSPLTFAIGHLLRVKPRSVSRGALLLAQPHHPIYYPTYYHAGTQPSERIWVCHGSAQRRARSRKRWERRAMARGGPTWGTPVHPLALANSVGPELFRLPIHTQRDSRDLE